MGVIRSFADGRAFRRDPLSFIRGLGEWTDIIQFRVGLSEFTLINHPDLIRRVLVTDAAQYGEGKWTLRGKHIMRDCLITREGAPHRERRRLVGPSFDRRRITQYVPGLTECAERMSAQWHNGARINTREAMGCLAIAMAGIAIFDANLEDEGGELNDALTVLNGAVSLLPLPRPRIAAARSRVRQTARRLALGHLGRHLAQAGLDEEEIVDELVSLLMAAVDTTPRALAWIWFLLGRNPEAEARLHRELIDVLACGRITIAGLQRLEFVQMVIDETLRLYPPVHFIDRRTLTEVELGGIRIPAGRYLLLSPLVTHRDPRFFSDSDRFRPERWSSDAAERAQTRVCFAFGAGAHRCIGEELARLEIAVVIATIARRWRLRAAPELASDPSPQTGELPMIVEQRV